MGTANTMCAMAEILGFSPNGNASVAALSEEWKNMAIECGHKIMELYRSGITAKKLVSKEAFLNAIRYCMATGGSTNSMLHIPAIAKQAGFLIEPNDFDRISQEIPVISTIYPNKKDISMKEFSEAGGLPAVVRELYLAGKFADTKGCFGSVEEKAESAINKNKDIIHSVDNPIYAQGGVAVLHGNIGTLSAVVKFSAVDEACWKFSGPARIFNSQKDAYQAGLKNELKKGDVVVIRYEGPKGSPGMPHLSSFMGIVVGKHLEKNLALITDGCFSGSTSGLAIGHVSPEAYEGGNIGLLRDGDIIDIDIEARSLMARVSDEEFEKRRKAFKPIEKPCTGWLRIFKENSTNAHHGASIYSADK